LPVAQGTSLLQKSQFEKRNKTIPTEDGDSDSANVSSVAQAEEDEDDDATCVLAALARPPAAPELDFFQPDRLRRALFSEIKAVLNGSHVEVAACRLDEIEGQMRAMFSALPKNEHGRLEHAVARYALFQRFSRKTGQIIHSLNPAGQAQTPSSQGEKLRGQVPMELLGLLEKEQGGRGIDLHELAAVVATLEHVLSGDMSERLKAAYDAHLLLPNSTVALGQASEVIKTFMSHYMSLEHRSGYAMTPEAAQKERSFIETSYPGWKTVMADVAGAVQRSAADSPGASLTFPSTKSLAKEVSDRYEERSASDCIDMKKEFIKLPNGTSGSVLLADLHQLAGPFREKTEYLRKAGALDESDPTAPRVLLPNLLYGTSNCLGTTSFADLCCPNECDMILAHLEQRLQTPVVAPADVASALTAEPGEPDLPAFSSDSLTRLEEVARSYGGRVPLHGHAVADWLHFAFPRECPRRRAEDFTHISSAAGRPDQEVPGSEREYQDVAVFRTLADFAATDEELMREARTLASLRTSAAASARGAGAAPPEPVVTI
jgi:hypothetical protein